MHTQEKTRNKYVKILTVDKPRKLEYQHLFFFFVLFCFLLKVAHVFQLIQNEHSAFSIHNEKQNMKIIKRASWQHKAELQQRAGFKL